MLYFLQVLPNNCSKTSEPTSSTPSTEDADKKVEGHFFFFLFFVVIVFENETTCTPGRERKYWLWQNGDKFHIINLPVVFNYLKCQKHLKMWPEKIVMYSPSNRNLFCIYQNKKMCKHCKRMVHKNSLKKHILRMHKVSNFTIQLCFN